MVHLAAEKNGKMIQRAEIIIRGAVQGIGFRPFIYRLASEMNLKGYVNNTTAGVYIEAEGEEEIIKVFTDRIEKEKPRYSLVEEISSRFTSPVNYKKFEILNNSFDGEPDTIILPDMALCSDCLKELFDPSDRRYLYPFINCTNCGPRFSIIQSIPYDRYNTTMREFEMCDDCRKEYTNPLDRRFHAEPVACHSCGPKVILWNKDGNELCSGYDSIEESAGHIRNGHIIALKGLGGFQLLADAYSDAAVLKLRRRKQRDEKPFALMFPSLESVREFCETTTAEEDILQSPESPIVILKKKKFLSEYIAPGNPYLGVMLPYTPLHHLLLKKLNTPVIATSGNISDEPMCIDEYQALSKLGTIADFFLVHNRKILRPVDDSIIKMVLDTPVILRRARGYAPLPVKSITGNSTWLAAGGHLKNSIALKKNNYIFLSQQIGDLSTVEAANNFEKTIADFQELYNTRNVKYICDLHPGYYSSRYAAGEGNPEMVQHHLAHIASCYGEHKLSGEVLGAAWDGTGLGFDNSIWGSEFFIYNGLKSKHTAQLLNYTIPGGEEGIRNLINSAAGILYAAISEEEIESNNILRSLFTGKEVNLLFKAIKKNINCYRTSSMGRLFDAVSFLLGLCERVSYEGQGAMMLEYSADENCKNAYSFAVVEENLLYLDWHPMIKEILLDLGIGVNKRIISAKFHNTLIDMIIYIAKAAGCNKVILSGGCFQNSILLKNSILRLREEGFIPYWNKIIPPNDSGISFGQIVYVMNRLNDKPEVINQEEKEYVPCGSR